MSYLKEGQIDIFSSIQNIRKMDLVDHTKTSMNLTDYNFYMYLQEILAIEKVSSLYLGEIDLKTCAPFLFDFKTVLNEVEKGSFDDRMKTRQYKANILIIRNDSEKIDKTMLIKTMNKIFNIINEISLLLSFQHICFINKDSFCIFENYISDKYLLDRINLIESGVNLDENSNFGKTSFMENKFNNIFTLEKDEEFENIFSKLEFFKEYFDTDSDVNSDVIVENNPNIDVNSLLQTIINDYKNDLYNRDANNKNER